MLVVEFLSVLTTFSVLNEAQSRKLEEAYKTLASLDKILLDNVDSFPSKGFRQIMLLFLCMY